MQFKLSVGALVAVSSLLVFAAPAADRLKINAGLRLIKVSEEDAGTWVTEEDKVTKYVAKNTNFIDITDIKDEEVLAALSGKAAMNSNARAAAVVYPTALSHITEANSFITKINIANPTGWLTTLTGFFTRYYRSATGTQSSTFIFNTVSQIAAANPQITVSRFTHYFNQPSIIARIPGTSSNLGKLPFSLFLYLQITLLTPPVIVGAHQDSVGSTSSGRSPGADDNGTGSVTILEAFRILATSSFAPKNTLEFHWYAGEEGGLLGSAAVFANYKSTSKTVLAMLNQDMTGYSPAGKPVVYTDYTNAALTAWTRLVVGQYTGISPLTSRCGYGCSDHASATSNGFPAAFVHEEIFATSNPKIHSASDVSTFRFSYAVHVMANALNRR
ncbi:putative leucine aminopeptidase 1 [Amylocarpus encephaloides]|uniref:Peptide hydrolase n=1 Tax=Amylocarpus encephaloides TaxID=45428 RepID=A0A9P7YTM6_9HELO|nr:putative leucine aminopeptidase 1 [Amylocarpus encephaloides]